MKAAIYPYKPYSNSARVLAEGLGVKRIKHEGSSFKGRDKFVVNWGATSIPAMCANGAVVLNRHEHVAIAQNKLSFFNKMLTVFNGPRIPRYFTILPAAEDFMRRTNKPLMVRTLLTGHSGRGIIYCDDPDQLTEAPLYVEYIKKISEYRIHFVQKYFHDRDYKIFIQRKAKRNNTPNERINWKIRNLVGGFIYASDPENIGDVPHDVIQQATVAFKKSKLHFGAVDVIYNKKKKEAYVLEINTAPGLVGRTAGFYIDNINNLLKTY